MYDNSYIINNQYPKHSIITFADRKCNKLRITKDDMSCIVDELKLSVVDLGSGYFTLYARYEDW